MIDDEVGKYRKKSTAKGQPRSKHKHIYETVLLRSYFEHTDMCTGKPIRTHSELPTKVCTICGRVDYVDTDPVYYVKNKVPNIPMLAFTKDLSDVALQLPKWEHDFFDKFATPMEDN